MQVQPVQPGTLVAAVDLRFRPNPLLLTQAPIGAADGYQTVDAARGALAQLTAGNRPAALIVSDGDLFRGYELVAQRGDTRKPFTISGRERAYKFWLEASVGIVDGSLFVPNTTRP